MTITDHKWVGAVEAPSPNHSGKITPKFVVMHYTAGWTAQSAINTFASRAAQVSAHVTIDRDGTVYQHVPFNIKAWHAGPSEYAGYSGLNSYSIGIEMVNPGFLRKTDSGAYVDSRGVVHSPEAVGATVPSTKSRAGSGTFYWPLYTDAQLKAAEDIVRSLRDKYNIIDVVSHEEIDTRGWKTDPGPAFPMARFKALLNDRGIDAVQYEVTANRLNVRAGPGADFYTSHQLSVGDKVVGLGTSGAWVRIAADQWTHSAYLRRMT